MLIYNVTTQVSWTIHDAWKKWMVEEQLPALLNTGVFSHHQFVRLLEVDEEDGPTYALQLYVAVGQSIDDYKQNYLPRLEQRERILWEGNAFSFFVSDAGYQLIVDNILIQH